MKSNAITDQPCTDATALLHEALPALNEFQQLFAAALEGIDNGLREEPTKTLVGSVPYLIQLAEFCEQAAADAPPLASGLNDFNRDLEQAFSLLLQAIESGDIVHIADIVRYRMQPLVAGAIAFFAVPETPRSPLLPPLPAAVPKPSMAMLKANLEALNDTFFGGIKCADILAAFTRPAPVTADAQGWRLAAIQDEPAHLLHSLIDPRQEADLAVAAWQRSQQVLPNGIVLLIGAGALYQLEALVRALGDKGRFAVVEPSLEALALALASRDLTALATLQGRLVFLSMPDTESLGRDFYTLLRNSPEMEVHLYPLHAWRHAREALYEEVAECLVAQARAEASNRITLAAFSDEWQQNAIVNLPQLCREPSVRSLFKRFEGCAALVVAAGPTLNDSLDVIRELAPRSLVIAVGTALRPLLAAGIRPHIVVHLDSDPITIQQFQGIDTEGIYLVSAVSVFPPIVKQFTGRIFSFSETLNSFGCWLQDIGACIGPLSIGGTVSLSAIDLAILLECSPIVTFGLDLALKEDGTSHAANSMYDGVTGHVGNFVRIPGNWQETVLSTRQFAGYVQIIANYINMVRQHRIPALYNATTGGARLPEIPAIRPDEAAELVLAAQPVDAPCRLQQISLDAPRPVPAVVIQAMQDVLHELGQLHALGTRAMRMCTRLGRLPREQARILRKLERIDRQLKENAAGLLLVDGAITGACMHLQRKLNEEEEMDHSFEHSRALYQQIAGAADWLRGLMSAALTDYETLHAGDRDA